MPVELQRKALSLYLRLLHPVENGFLPKTEDMKYLVAGKLDQIDNLDLSYHIRYIAKVLVGQLLTTSVVMRLHAQERYALDGGSSSGEPFSVGEFLSTVESDLFTKSLGSFSSDDWNLQYYFVKCILELYKHSSSMPSPINALILIQLERVDQALVAALNRLENQPERLQLVARESSASPSKDELLQAHLLSLHTELYSTVCATSATCILPLLASWQSKSGAQATAPAAAALISLALALGTQLLG